MKRSKWLPGLILVFLFSLPSHAAGIRDVQESIRRVGSIKAPFHFAVLGDSRDGDTVYRQMNQKILERKPDFIIHLGDMVRRPDAKLWDSFFELSEPIRVPFFPVVGNHDVLSADGGQLSYRKQFLLPEDKAYYSFRAGGVFFGILDSEEGKGKLLNGQWNWLEQQLSSSKEAFKLMFLHRPLFLPVDSFKKGKGMDKNVTERDRLHGLFLKQGVKAVIEGDDHRYDRREKDRILYVITGGGGGPLSALRDRGGYFHYVWVSVRNGKIEGETVDLEGQLRDRFVIE